MITDTPVMAWETPRGYQLPPRNQGQRSATFLTIQHWVRFQGQGTSGGKVPGVGRRVQGRPGELQGAHSGAVNWQHLRGQVWSPLPQTEPRELEARWMLKCRGGRSVWGAQPASGVVAGPEGLVCAMWHLGGFILFKTPVSGDRLKSLLTNGLFFSVELMSLNLSDHRLISLFDQWHGFSGWPAGW